MTKQRYEAGLKARMSAEEIQNSINRLIKDGHEHYLRSPEAKADKLNRDLQAYEANIANILAGATQTKSRFSVITLSKTVAPQDILENLPDIKVPEIPILEALLPEKLGWFSSILKSRVAQHRKALNSAISQFNNATHVRNQILRYKETTLRERDRKVHERELLQRKAEREAKLFNEGLQQVSDAARNGEEDAIVYCVEALLETLSLPDTFPKKFRAAFETRSRQLVVEYKFPLFEEAVPEVERVSYVRTRDKVVPKLKSDKRRAAQYSDLISQLCLRILFETFRSVDLRFVSNVVINGYLETTDRSTGQFVSPSIVSIRVTREKFDTLVLDKVDPIKCLKGLSAVVSRSPKDLVPIRPIIEFDMVDPRFVPEQDIISQLDSRPNLMELTPSEFESLITNMFQKMGLETKMTQASRDGGVDCVAYDSRPILGGKVVVQAKRYKNTVGVSAVRDLFGTMHNEGASKGILVTTSGYGNAAYTFANGKPLELITGSNLLYLLKEHAGVDAKIKIPDDWVEPSYEQ